MGSYFLLTYLMLLYLSGVTTGVCIGLKLARLFQGDGRATVNGGKRSDG